MNFHDIQYYSRVSRKCTSDKTLPRRRMLIPVKNISIQTPEPRQYVKIPEIHGFVLSWFIFSISTSASYIFKWMYSIKTLISIWHPYLLLYLVYSAIRIVIRTPGRPPQKHARSAIAGSRRLHLLFIYGTHLGRCCWRGAGPKSRQEEMVVTFGDQLVEHLRSTSSFWEYRGNTRISRINDFVVENNLFNATFFGWNQITKSRGVSADWMVCGVELRDVDSWSCLHSLKLFIVPKNGCFQ